MKIIETRKLTHRFSASETVLDSISLTVAEGSIYGFLGPNGAGKTTTLKLILGLLKKQQGEIRIFGTPLEDNRLEILRNLGSLIESPSLYGHLTAVENLEVLQRVYRSPKDGIAKVLDMVGLADTGRKKVHRFSLGMKQRLSIAIALLHKPKLLILDEPTNGLDPNGIIEMRELLRRLNQDRGITILISSHLLSEIEKLVNHVGIINKGKLLFQGTLAELQRGRQESSVVFRTSNDPRASQIIGYGNSDLQISGDRLTIGGIGPEQIARINERLVLNQIDVYEIKPVENDLEKIFLDVIKD
ncbi:MAG: ABC transporter ATP-binding protein [Pyrinomonadaceae bacterium]